MPLNEKKIQEILKKHKYDFEDIANYDRTREWMIGRKRIDITLDKKIIRKIQQLKENTGKPISRIIEDAIKKII